mmetsp:Transcript_2145/g.3177  ORF Transcript_2145/g.3177 Transcript_2145/m.3177 type:complete len:237 (-) Transcript_2145:1060-1770(-)|eukprot:CAMPEP_0194200654 /NCGR_PEP_ID=MMETSP0156-20130528/1167_1 /TAXON_ID=33649 /ORGANISM="Thalassionema nitzschioides, Strain L26-B" /LENGTH=236 /DNA_ID=CAMNT_0038925681 /DNA_START=157 /DNA_END=867 /DNA_ORIENTATION=+
MKVVFILIFGLTSVLSFCPELKPSVRDVSSLAAKKEATFGMGCFWKPAENLLKVPGVIDTVAGYTGNPEATNAPNYDSVCFGRKWVEGVRVYYDDEKLYYEDLLEAFFEAQEPKLDSRQYASIIFPHDKDQEAIAQKWLSSGQGRNRSDGVPVETTQLEPLSKFYQAEGYHQRYWAKQRPRFALIIGTIALSLSPVDDYIPSESRSSFETVLQGIGLAVTLYAILERAVDRKVIEL